MININNTDWDKLQKEDIEQAIRDGEESFFFEFKDDRVDTKKIVQEISALANTYGGYIFIGVSDNKEIDGCTNWNEQKIHITIHESLSPIPPFDVKKFVFDDEKTVYVIKVDKGLEPPYITNRGMIYERVSSGSFVVKDSSKLTQMYYQRENELKRIEEKISIPPNTETIGNLFGYIDVGFQFYSTNIKAMQDAFFRFDINDYNNKLDEDASHPSISRVGNTIVCVFNGLSADRKKWLPANANYFMEIMCDGSVKYRTLLLDSDSIPALKGYTMFVFEEYKMVVFESFEPRNRYYVFGMPKGLDELKSQLATMKKNEMAYSEFFIDRGNHIKNNERVLEKIARFFE